MDNKDDVKQAINELEEYVKFQKFIKEEKGGNYTVEECYNIVQWFKDGNNEVGLNPTNAILFHYGHREAIFFIGEPDQMDRIYELYYALKYGNIPLKDKLKID